MTFDDAELLNKAAKAAGHMLGWNYDHSLCWLLKDWEGMPNSDDPWDPLNDDGDALRLVIKLSLDIKHDLCDQGIEVTVTAGWDDAPDPVQEVFEDAGAPALRRAITRYAAAIGEKS